MGNYKWVESKAARARLEEIEQSMRAMARERELLRQVVPPEASLPEVIAQTMATRPDHAWSVGELVRALPPSRVAARNASALVSASLSQGCHGRHPRFVAGQGGRGRPRLYRLHGYRGKFATA